MTLVVGQLGFAKHSKYYGLELCLDNAGRESYEVTAKTFWGFDVVLVTLFWWTDFFKLCDFLAKVGWSPHSGKKPIVIAGGIEVSMCPELSASLVDYAFVGDADTELAPILDDIERCKEPRSRHLVGAAGFCPCVAEMPVFTATISNKETKTNRRLKRGKIQGWRAAHGSSTTNKMETSRGCKFSCPYCALSAIKPYREAPADAVIAALRGLDKTTQTHIFSAERTSHSGWQQIAAEIDRLGLKDRASDTRIEGLASIPGDRACCGIDGVSERLGATIKKKYSNKQIMGYLQDFMTSGRRLKFGGAVWLYFLADVPGETLADYDRIASLLDDLQTVQWSRQLCVGLLLNPLSPKPGTAMADVDVNVTRDYQSVYNALVRPDGNRRCVRVTECAVVSPIQRALDLAVHRAGSAALGLLRYRWRNPAQHDDAMRYWPELCRVFDLAGIDPLTGRSIG